MGANDIPSPTPVPSLVTYELGSIPADTTPNSWMTYQLKGITSPGTIPRGGIRGFKRETGWDIKKGKGTEGASLTLVTMPPVEGSIICQIFTDLDFQNWDYFVANAVSLDPVTTAAQGLAIYHPQFQSISLSAVVVKHYTGPEYQGKGMYHVTVEFIEWSPPPAKSITSNVTTNAPDIAAPTTAPRPVNPEIVTLKSQISIYQQAAASGAPPGGPR